MTRIAEIIENMRLFYAIKMCIDLKIPEMIPSESGLPLDVLHRKINDKDQKVLRLIDFLVVHGFFRIVKDHIFHSVDSKELLPNQNARKFADFYCADWCISGFSGLAEAVSNEKSAFELRNGKNLFDYLNSDMSAYNIFNKAMTHDAHFRGENLAYFYDFSKYETIADIGGGTGAILNKLLDTYPLAKGILFDTTPTIQEAKSLYKHSNRVEYIDGNFFDPLNFSADIFFLFHIVHDWCDDDVIRILKNCSSAMKSSSPLLIIERILGKSDKSAHGMDLTMMALTDRGRERNLDDFKYILDQAGLKLNNLYATRTQDYILEAMKK